MSALTNPIDIWKTEQEVEILIESFKELRIFILEQNQRIKNAEAEKLEAISQIEKSKFAELTTAYDLGFKAGYNQGININQKQNEQQTTF